jgi:NitT/TauT family transport system substrate-binding protein
MRAGRILASIALAAPLAPGAHAIEHVNVGISNSSSDVGIFIADTNGYFRDEGLEIKIIPFDSASKMVAPMGAGEVDAGTGSAAAGLYTAYARGIHVQIVADTASAPPGYGHNILLVRKDLIASGRYRTLQDFRGMKVALTAPGASSNSTMNEALKQWGLAFRDIEPVYLGYPAHVTALVNRGVDAGLTAEPAATQAIAANAAVRVMSDDIIDPYHEAAVTLYSAKFAHERQDAAMAYMRAYLKAVRFYNDALAGGGLKGPTAEAVIKILTDSTPVKDAAIYRAISPQGCNPDGHVNVASLEKDFAFYKTQGWIEGEVKVTDLVDDSFAAAAVKVLGPYRPKAQ